MSIGKTSGQMKVSSLTFPTLYHTGLLNISFRNYIYFHTFLYCTPALNRTPNNYTVRENSVEFGLFVYRLGHKVFILETRVRLSYRPQY